MIKTALRPCNLCGSESSVFAFDARDRLHGVEGSFRYVRCSACGLLYMNPQVVPEDLQKLYPCNYSPHSIDGKGATSSISFLYNLLIRAPLLSRLLRWIIDAKIINSVLSCLNRDSRILDVGCGSGLFLDRMSKEKGCKVYGVDVSATAVDSAKSFFGLDVFKGEITEAPFKDGSFDVITAWWYLEHVVNPQESIAKMSGLLRDGGFCIIGVPNYESFFARIFKDRWYDLDCPRHLHVWSLSTMKKVLGQNGLQVTNVLYGKTPGGALGSLQYLLLGGNINPRFSVRLDKNLLLWLALLPWTIILSFLKRSDSIVVYARKPKKN